MGISDIITLVSLILAIVAIINEKQRGNLILKFHVVDYVIFIGSFILINYFVFYQQFYDKGIYLNCFYYSGFGFKDPKHWAYIISMITFVYLSYKILYAFYPYAKREAVLSFYKKLIETNELSFLLDLIEEYHKKDIIAYINGAKEVKTDETWWHRSMRENNPTILQKGKVCWMKFIRTIAPWASSNRKLYGNLVLYNVLNDPAFVTLAASQRPYLFFEIFGVFKEVKRHAFPDDLINRYLVELIRHKNFWLVKELKECERFDRGQPEQFFEENKIISSLFSDLNVSDVNEVWRPFGEAAHEEIDAERLKGLESKLYEEFRGEQFLWEFKTFICIKFFEYLIVEAILKKYKGTHFWLHYYERITEAILNTFEEHDPFPEAATKSIYFKFIDIMLSIIFHWLDLSNREEDDSRFHDLLRCLGGMVYYITSNPYVDDEIKVGLIDRIFNFYCNMDENSQSDAMRTKLDEILLRPSMLYKTTDPYGKYVGMAWKKFDTVPHRINLSGQDYDYFKRLKDNVIIPWGLDPDEPY